MCDILLRSFTHFPWHVEQVDEKKNLQVHKNYVTFKIRFHKITIFDFLKFSTSLWSNSRFHLSWLTWFYISQIIKRKFKIKYKILKLYFTLHWVIATWRQTMIAVRHQTKTKIESAAKFIGNKCCATTSKRIKKKTANMIETENSKTWNKPRENWQLS